MRVQCPECSLTLVGKLSALQPCGHVCHHHCAQYMQSTARSNGGLCPRCRRPFTDALVVHLEGTEDAARSQSDVVARDRRIAELQRTIAANRDDSRKARADLVGVRRRCATLHAEVSDLQRRTSELTSGSAGTRSGTSSPVPAGAATVPDVAANFATDPLTSIAQLQEYIASALDGQRTLRSNVAATETDCRRLRDELVALKQARKRRRAAVLDASTERHGARATPVADRRATAAEARRSALAMDAALSAAVQNGDASELVVARQLLPAEEDRAVARVSTGADAGSASPRLDPDEFGAGGASAAPLPDVAAPRSQPSAEQPNASASPVVLLDEGSGFSRREIDVDSVSVVSSDTGSVVCVSPSDRRVPREAVAAPVVRPAAGMPAHLAAIGQLRHGELPQPHLRQMPLRSRFAGSASKQ